MYCLQNKIYCGVCKKSYLPYTFPNQIKTQKYVDNVLKNQCTNSLMIKTHYKKR